MVYLSTWYERSNTCYNYQGLYVTRFAIRTARIAHVRYDKSTCRTYRRGCFLATWLPLLVLPSSGCAHCERIVTCRHGGVVLWLTVEFAKRLLPLVDTRTLFRAASLSFKVSLGEQGFVNLEHGGDGWHSAGGRIRVQLPVDLEAIAAVDEANDDFHRVLLCHTYGVEHKTNRNSISVSLIGAVTTRVCFTRSWGYVTWENTRHTCGTRWYMFNPLNCVAIQVTIFTPFFQLTMYKKQYVPLAIVKTCRQGIWYLLRKAQLQVINYPSDWSPSRRTTRLAPARGPTSLTRNMVLPQDVTAILQGRLMKHTTGRGSVKNCQARCLDSSIDTFLHASIIDGGFWTHHLMKGMSQSLRDYDFMGRIYVTKSWRAMNPKRYPGDSHIIVCGAPLPQTDLTSARWRRGGCTLI